MLVIVFYDHSRQITALQPVNNVCVCICMFVYVHVSVELLCACIQVGLRDVNVPVYRVWARLG